MSKQIPVIKLELGPEFFAADTEQPNLTAVMNYLTEQEALLAPMFATNDPNVVTLDKYWPDEPDVLALWEVLQERVKSIRSAFAVSTRKLPHQVAQCISLEFLLEDAMWIRTLPGPAGYDQQMYRLGTAADRIAYAHIWVTWWERRLNTPEEQQRARGRRAQRVVYQRAKLTNAGDPLAVEINELRDTVKQAMKDRDEAVAQWNEYVKGLKARLKELENQLLDE